MVPTKRAVADNGKRDQAKNGQNPPQTQELQHSLLDTAASQDTPDVGYDFLLSREVDMDQQGQAALVTGASRGIGKEIALELARRGWRVAVNYFNDPQAMVDAAVAEIRAVSNNVGSGEVAPVESRPGENSSINVIPVQADIRSSTQVSAMFENVISTFGRLDLLVNNAGVQTWKALLDVTEEEWDLVIDTNLKGCFLCTQQAGRYMKDHGGGAIVNLGSGCNKVAFPRLVAYTASKGGIEMFTKEAAVELGQYGIRVNCIAPGSIESERTRAEDPDYAGTWSRLTPLGRVGTAADIAATVAFLASKDAEFISGQTIWIDGGLFTQAPWPYKK
jgi:NAD(P)-dependent dehydrogenase (short-subunit alcohol dehydrogenase family)